MTTIQTIKVVVASVQAFSSGILYERHGWKWPILITAFVIAVLCIEGCATPEKPKCRPVRRMFRTNPPGCPLDVERREK